MRLKEYLAILQKLYPADSDDPVVIVQQLACLAAMKLSNKGSLPKSCGRGVGVDMDIVQAGVLAGLEKLRKLDTQQANLRPFLYPNIAGRMYDYAWSRENRVSHALWKGNGFEGVDYEESWGLSASTEGAEETEVEIFETNTRLKAAIETLPVHEAAFVTQYSGLGRDNAARLALADSLGVSYAALRVRASRIRKKLKENELQSSLAERCVLC